MKWINKITNLTQFNISSWLIVVVVAAISFIVIFKVVKRKVLMGSSLLARAINTHKKEKIGVYAAYQKEYKKSILNAWGFVSFYDLKSFAKKDKEFMCEYIKIHHKNVPIIPNEFYEDKEFCLKALRNMGSSDFCKIPNEFSKDKEFVRRAIKHNYSYFEKTDSAFKKDKEVCKIAILQFGLLYEKIDDSLKEDRELMLLAISKYPRNLSRLKEEYKNDKKIVLHALNCAKEKEHYGHPRITVESVLELASPEIVKLCLDKDPIVTLNSAILAEDLSKELDSNQIDKAKKINKV